MLAHADAASAGGGGGGADDTATITSATLVDHAEPRSVLDDDSDGEEGEDYIDDDDDRSSSLSIPNESIDFDLVYSLHSFAATVEGQANVVKGDRLFLIDDSNSYWWLVRVLKTQEVGYIPAENIETPFERLARLNKHRNVDLASATQAEMQGDLNASRDRLGLRAPGQTPSPVPGRTHSGRRLVFTSAMSVHRYAPAIWDEDEEEEDDDVSFDVGEYEAVDPDLEEDEKMRGDYAQGGAAGSSGGHGMEPDDGMQWDDTAAEEMQRQQQQAQARARAMAEAAASGDGGVPAALRAGTGGGDAQQQQMLRQQQAQVMAQQQQQQDQWAAQQQHAAQQQQPQKELRASNSRERLTAGPAPEAPRSDSNSPNNNRWLDPAEATETVRVNLTPSVVRSDDERAGYNHQQQESAKRAREEEEDASRKAAKGPKDKSPSPGPVAQNNKLRKSEPVATAPTREEEVKEKEKKKKGMFGNLFGGRKKDKHKGGDKNASVTSFDSNDNHRVSEESNKSSRPSGGSGSDISPTTTLAMQQQQQQQQAAAAAAAIAIRSSGDSRQSTSTSERGHPQVSQHASQLRQHDQQQMLRYQQQHLSRGSSSPPESTTQPSYGLQSVSALSTGPPVNSGLGPPPPPPPQPRAAAAGPPRPRPGSLILNPSSIDGSSLFPAGVQHELSVIRVFAGKNLQTEATFKTALLNSSTTSSDLIRQAIQRFRLPIGEAAAADHSDQYSDYYLTVKQVEGGSSTVLQDHEHPLVVFETLVTEAAMEIWPKVKRSSMGSISSVASNLSMHPAIKKLPMNDFTDDSMVKFYLNRRNEDGVEDSEVGHHEDGVEGGGADVDEYGRGEGEQGVAMVGDTIVQSPRNQYLTVSTAMMGSATSERFSSPSIRFALQLVINREHLPDDMAFHPTTEAIVSKEQLRESDLATQPVIVNPNMRKKVFMFPKNVTVAEVIELGLERFGISEGVVDGGDEVEDKSAKRRSSGRIRYGLWVNANINGHERELTPSSKVIDAYPKAPIFRSPDRMSGNLKRRSVDSAHLLGNMEDVQPDDPIFFLRRSVSYRNSTSRHRISAPLDEIELHKIHRESAASSFSQASADSPAHNLHGQQHAHLHGHAQPQRQQQQQLPSAQEIIAAQRAASRANQIAILTAQSNSHSGTDILLPDNALLRSSRYDATERMRYSYVEPDGETYDISDIVEAEWGTHPEPSAAGKNDLLATVVGEAGARSQQGLGANLDRVLSKIRSGKVGKERDVGSIALTVSAEGGDEGDHVDEEGEEEEEEEDGDVVGDTLGVGGGGLGGGMGTESKRESHNSVPSVSEYSVESGGPAGSRSITPGSAGFVSRMPGAPSATTAIAATAGVTVAPTHPHTHSRSMSSLSSEERADRSSPILPRASTSTPTGRLGADRRQPSLASVMSDSTSGYVTPPPYPNPIPVQESPRSFVSGHTGGSGISNRGASANGSGTSSSSRRRTPVIPKDDFGISHMMAIIEYKTAQAKNQENKEKEKQRTVDVVEERLFGTPVDLDTLHPQVRGIYEGGFKMLEDMDKVLDSYMQPSIGAF